MHHFNQGRFRHQVQFLRRQFLQDGDLPFTDVLSEDLIAQTLTAVGVFWTTASIRRSSRSGSF